jgi:oligopeptide transport system substrate-binding protein
MKSNKLFTILGLLVIASMILAACGGGAADTAADTSSDTSAAADTSADTSSDEEAMEAGPVTSYGYSTTDIPSLDPQIATDSVSINYIESLFVHLTNYDLITAEVVPEAATSWTVSDDGLVYTFTVRTDIPWVSTHPGTGEVTQVLDDEGNGRFVTAHDFAYGIQRACDPALGSYYSSVIAPQIVGCEDVLYETDPEAAIGAVALDDSTLEVTLAFPAGFFLSMTPMWPLAAVPQFAIEEHGDNWTEAGFIVTSGRYGLETWVHGVSRTLSRNNLMPADMNGGGNIERWEVNVVPDPSTGYALWLAGEVDTAGIPGAELQAHLEQYPDETDQIADLVVFYIAFDPFKAPFDDARVRRAFAASVDRATLVSEVFQGAGLPMRHFAPPGIFGAPAIDEVGVGYDPDYAAAQLADAGFPNCEGFPEISLLGYSGETTLNWIEFMANGWSEILGCDPELIQTEQLSFSDLLAATDNATPVEDRVHIHTLGWGPDYADENNWVGDVLKCEVGFVLRDCSETDDLIDQARVSADPAERVELYRQIEEAFFGAEGEMPMAPLYVRIAFTARHSWLSYDPALFGGEQWYTWTIDQGMQMEAMQ